LLFSSLLGCAVVGAVPVYATLLARGQPVAWWVTTWWQITTLAGWAMLAPLILALRRRFAVLSGADDGTPITMVELAAHAGIITIAALAHSAILVMFTRLLFVPLGVATTLSAIGWAFAAYFLLDALAYVLIFALAHASDIERRAREASRRTALLVAQLDQSRLVALRAQLRPHFLFNALNAAVVLVRRGDAEAATVLTGLAELLRYVLDDGEEMVSLDEELTFAGRYLAIEQVRVGERLRFAIDAAADVRIALVPRLMLQPIVENAVRHGIAKQLRPGEIRVRATRAQETLILCVEDDGPGPGALAAAGAERDVRAGIGLSNTRARLESLFGASASVTLRAREGGGAVTEILLPYLTEHRARSA